MRRRSYDTTSSRPGYRRRRAVRCRPAIAPVRPASPTGTCFNWQTYYLFATPLQLPKGARILSSAWYDNSAANRANPDPRVDVKWGDQTWEEMQYTGVLYSLR